MNSIPICVSTTTTARHVTIKYINEILNYLLFIINSIEHSVNECVSFERISRINSEGSHLFYVSLCAFFFIRSYFVVVAVVFFNACYPRVYIMHAFIRSFGLLVVWSFVRTLAGRRLVCERLFVAAFLFLLFFSSNELASRCA